MACGGHRRVGTRCEQRGHAANEGRLEQRLVTLHVHDDLVVGQAEQRGRLRQPVGAREVLGPREAHGNARGRHGGVHAIVVGRHHDAGGAALHRTLRYAHDHRLAGDVGQRLARQPCRCVTRRDEDGEGDRGRAHSYSAG